MNIEIHKHVKKVIEKHHGKVLFVEHIGHGCYFALVFLQGHGFYTYIAGALAIGTALHLLVGSLDDEV